MKFRCLRFAVCSLMVLNLEGMFSPIYANQMMRQGGRVLPFLKNKLLSARPPLASSVFAEQSSLGNPTRSYTSLSGTKIKDEFLRGTELPYSSSVRDYHEIKGPKKSFDINSYFVDTNAKNAIVKQLEAACEYDDELNQEALEFIDSIDEKNAKIAADMLKYRNDEDKFTSAVEALKKHAILKEVEKIPNANLILFEHYLGRSLNPNSPYSELSLEEQRMVYQGAITYSDIMDMINFSLQRTGYYTTEEIGKELERLAKDSAAVLDVKSEYSADLSDIILLSYHLDKEMDKALSTHETATNLLCLGFISSFMAWNFVPGVNEAVTQYLPVLAEQAWDVVEGPLTFSMFVKMIYDSKQKRVGTFYKFSRAREVLKTLSPK